MSALEVYAIETRVVLPHRPQEGTIVGVHIFAANHVQYAVMWWDDNGRAVEWVEDFEVEPKERATKVTIGFR